MWVIVEVQEDGTRKQFGNTEGQAFVSKEKALEASEKLQEGSEAEFVAEKLHLTSV